MKNINDITDILSAVDEINLKTPKKNSTRKPIVYNHIPKLNQNLPVPADLDKLILEAEEYKKKSSFKSIDKNTLQNQEIPQTDNDILILKNEVEENSNRAATPLQMLTEEISNLKKAETQLRLEIVELQQDKTILLNNSKNYKKTEDYAEHISVTKETLKIIYSQVESLKQSFLNLKSYSIKVERDSSVFKENYERLVIENNELKTRLKIAKEQIVNFENNKTNLLSALDQLNAILSKNNIVGKISSQKPQTNENDLKKGIKIDSID